MSDDADPTDHARPEVRFKRGEQSAIEQYPPLPWYRQPTVLFGAAACAALVAVVGLVLTLRSGGVSMTPAVTTQSPTATTSLVAPVEAPPPAATETVVVQQAPPPWRQPALAPRVAPPPTTVVTTTTVVTSPAPVTTGPSTSQCTPPNCITVPEPDPRNCGYTGQCPGPTTDPVIAVPEPGPTNCGYTGDCGTLPGNGGGSGDPGSTWTDLRPANLPPGAVC